MLTIIILLALLIASIYGNINLTRKIEALEDQYEEASSYVDALNAGLEELKTRVMESHARLKDIDRRGAFEADDEVGFFFKELLEISDELTKLLGVSEQEEQPFKTGYAANNKLHVKR